ncbi:right-handed parallel beta-helix repeat-containing protein [Pseudomonas sp. HK3]
MLKKTFLRKIYFYLFTLITLFFSGHAFSLQCDITIESGQYLLDGTKTPVMPGDNICLKEGLRGPMRVTNIHGNEEAPITILNESGLVTFTPFEYSIALEYSSFIRITSHNQDSTDPYKMKFGGTLSIGQLSHDVEVDNIEIYRTRFAGMMIKTDPDCRSETWGENFTMTGINLHHNFIHDTGKGEGMYVGYTALSRTLECDGEMVTVYPHKMKGVRIHDNIIENTGADGIQLNSVLADAQIKNNKIYNTGVSPFAVVWQNTGIQVGGDGVEVHNNTIIRSGGNSMMLDGDDLSIKNNVIIDAGENGIFARNAAQQNPAVFDGIPHTYSGNHIINSKDYAIKLYAVNTLSPNLIYRNIIQTDGSVDAANRLKTFSYLNDSVSRAETDNRHYIFNPND